MNSLFSQSNSHEIIRRINHLSPDNKAIWGKMNVSQMLTHCQLPLKLAIGEHSVKRTLAGIIFGSIARKQLVKQEPFKTNLPTAKEFIVTDERDFYEPKNQHEDILGFHCHAWFPHCGRAPHGDEFCVCVSCCHSTRTSA